MCLLAPAASSAFFVDSSMTSKLVLYKNTEVKHNDALNYSL